YTRPYSGKYRGYRETRSGKSKGRIQDSRGSPCPAAGTPPAEEGRKRSANQRRAAKRTSLAAGCSNTIRVGRRPTQRTLAAEQFPRPKPKPAGSGSLLALVATSAQIRHRQHGQEL